ncbi:MAG: bifunctional class I SAM-dependent methyltransferase/glycosyltransferase family 2 protein [Cytophagales bacterium]|nr:bifunctional class I SAM-dependent methyltransferase/glycosyltransferase family 2 protein [Cytophagales bacterium]
MEQVERNIKQKRRKEFLDHFNKLAPDLAKYRKRYAYFWNDILRYCNYFIHEDDSVLEIGCANGDALARLNGKKKTGIDFSSGMIEIARKNHPDINFYAEDAERIRLDEKFDTIILSHVTGYFTDVLKVFSSLRSICHPRTRIIINYYNFLWEPILLFGEAIGIKRSSPKQNWLTKRDLQTFLYIAGYETYRSTRRVLLPINIPVLSWFFNKFIGRLPIINLLCLNQYIFARPSIGLPKSEYSTSIVIPARNESGNLENALKRLPKFGSHQEIIFVEGNSTDDTWEQMQQLPAKYPDLEIKVDQQPGKGKGDAVRKGFSLAKGEILMILDADLTVPPEDLPAFYFALIKNKGEFINGSRLVYPMEKNAMRLLNLLGNKFFSVLFSWLLEQPIKDTLCGTKVIFRKDYEKLIKNRSFFGEFDPFGDFDLIFGAYKMNLKIIDLPVRYRERVYGDTNISRFSHGFLLLRMVGYAARKIKFY